MRLPAAAPSLALVLFAATLLVAPRGGRAEPFFLPPEREGSWLASDKTLHFAGAAALAMTARVEGRREGTAFAAAVGAGIVKEIYDATLKPARHGRGASRKDLVVDLLGAAAGIVLVRALDR